MIINNNLTALSALNANRAADEIAGRSVKPSAKVHPVVDDSTELTINERVRSQIKGNDFAVKNVQDGLSMLRVAEGVFSNTGDILNKMRELCVQAGNDKDRAGVQEELDKLKSQLNYISRYTNFSSQNLLNGNAVTNCRIEVRSDPGRAQVQKSNTMSVTETMLIDDLEVYHDKELWEISQFYDTDGGFLVEEPQELVLIQGDGKTASVVLYGSDTLQDTAAKFNKAIAHDLGQSAYADGGTNFAQLSEYSRSALYDDDGKIQGYDMKSTLLVQSAIRGREGEINFTGNNGVIRALGLSTIQASQEGTLTVSVYDTHTGGQTFAVQFGNVSATMLGVDGVSVMTDELAKQSVTTLDEALDGVVKQRTQITSYCNGLERSLSDMNPNAQIANDYDAKSMMRYIEFQILSKAEGSLQVQANQQPEAIFSLLGNQTTN